MKCGYSPWTRSIWGLQNLKMRPSSSWALELHFGTVYANVDDRKKRFANGWHDYSRNEGRRSIVKGLSDRAATLAAPSFYFPWNPKSFAIKLIVVHVLIPIIPPSPCHQLSLYSSIYVSILRKEENPGPESYSSVCVCVCVSKGGIKSIELQWTTIAHWNLLTFTFCPSRAEDYYAREIHYSQECHRQFDKSFQATTITSRNTTTVPASSRSNSGQGWYYITIWRDEKGVYGIRSDDDAVVVAVVTLVQFIHSPGACVIVSSSEQSLDVRWWCVERS